MLSAPDTSCSTVFHGSRRLSSHPKSSAKSFGGRWPPVGTRKPRISRDSTCSESSSNTSCLGRSFVLHGDMRARFIYQIGIAGQLRIYWDKIRGKEVFDDGYVSTTSLNDCPCSYGRQGSPGIHNAYASLGNKEGTEDWECFGKNEDYPSERWP